MYVSMWMGYCIPRDCYDGGRSLSSSEIRCALPSIAFRYCSRDVAA